MRVEPIDNKTTFGYCSPVKTLFKKGKLPLKYGFYGDELTIKNCTIEHLLPVCQGGKTTLDNVVLVSANKNQERGVRPLQEMLNWENVGRYFEPFKDFKYGSFDGNAYIQGILKTIKELIGG